MKNQLQKVHLHKLSPVLLLEHIVYHYLNLYSYYIYNIHEFFETKYLFLSKTYIKKCFFFFKKKIKKINYIRFM